MPITQSGRNLLFASIVIAALALALAFGLTTMHLSPGSLPFQVKNKDFANYWMAGRAGLGGNATILFGNPAAYFEAMKAVFGTDYPWHNWSYPPHAVLFLLPLGMFDYLPAMAVFLGATLVLYLAAVQSLRPAWTPVAAILLLPFVAGVVVTTQNGFLTAALMVGGLGLRDRRPIVAGILFGMLTFKPQLGLLVPVLLLYERRWSVIASACLTTVILIAVSALAFGTGSWTGYIRYVAPHQTEIMNTFDGDFPHMMGSAFGAARSLGFAAPQAMWIHLPFAIAGLGLFLISLWRLGHPHARAFAMLLASLLIVPYSVAYDFGAVATFSAFWPLAGASAKPALPLRAALMLVAMLPTAMLPLGQAGLPLTPVILIGAFILLLASEGAFRVRSVTDDAPKPLRDYA